MTAQLRKLMPETLTAEQHDTLRYIQERGLVTSSELADYFFVGKSSITAIVKRLVDKGYLERRPDAVDRRVTYLAITPVGEQSIAEVQNRIEELLARYIVHFENSEAQLFVETFEKLAHLVVNDEKEVRENE